MDIRIAIFQQITGINAILYYAPKIFNNTGVSAAMASMQTIAIGVTMLIFTLVAIWLVNKAGRKKLLLAGCVIIAISLLAVAACFHYNFYQYYLVLIFLLVYIAGFSTSLGAVTWVILSKIFPNLIRGARTFFSNAGVMAGRLCRQFLFSCIK